MDIYSLIDDVADRSERLVRGMTGVSADQLGLDIRAAGRVYIDCDCIAVPSTFIRSMDYYGGFEYVDKEYRHQFGDYTFFTADDDRVAEALAYFYEGKGIDSEDDEG